MFEKKKNSNRRNRIRRMLLIMIPTAVITFLVLLMFDPLARDSNNAEEIISIHYGITLDDATNVHYRTMRYNINHTRTVFTYTVPAEKVDNSLSNTHYDCLLIERASNYMPEFTMLNMQWWIADEAIQFEGANCTRANAEYLVTYHILIEYRDNNLATVYIEIYW